MAISFLGLDDTATFAWKASGSTSTKSYTHTAGGDLILLDVARGESGTANFTATYDGVSMTRLAQIDTGEGVTSLFRLSDPGSKTANLIVTNGGIVANGQNFYIMRMSGLDASPLGASAGSEAWSSDETFSQGVTLQEAGSLSLVVFNTANGNASAITMDSPLTALTFIDNSLDGAAPASRVGYVIGHGAGARTYTGSWTGTDGWSRRYVFELLAADDPALGPFVAHNRFHNLAA